MNAKRAVGVLVQVALALTVMIFGWGFDDVRVFFAHPARAIFIAVALLSVALVLFARIDVNPFRPGTRTAGRQRWTLAVLFVISLLMVWFLPHADRRGWLTFAGADLLRYLGVALYAVGNVLAFLAVRTLGKQYSGYVTLQENHQLVQTGIYGVIRHPIYLRLLLVALGVPLLFRSWLAAPALAAGALFVARRIQSEEKLLAEQFGADFEAYRRRTWRLVPYLY